MAEESLIDWIVDTGCARSRSEARRLCHAGAVESDGRKIGAIEAAKPFKGTGFKCARCNHTIDPMNPRIA